MKTVTIPIKGLTIAGCALELEKSPGKREPIRRVDENMYGEDEQEFSSLSSRKSCYYAREQLIQEQTEFNKWLLGQIPMNLFYHPVQILGSNANPAELVVVPRYVQPTRTS